jgi:hypothetical protein
LPLFVASIGIGAGMQPAPAVEFLEVSFERIDNLGTLEYAISFSANKGTATTAELQTPRGTYTCVWSGDEWRPEPSFWADHRGLTFSELLSLIAPDWLLTWDKDLLLETVAHINYGSVAEVDFPIVPIITQPTDGATGVASNTSIEWNYGGGDPCSPAPDRIEVCIVEPTPVLCIEMDDCSDMSWSPPSPLPEDDYLVAVLVGQDIRDVADGIGGPIQGDPWVLENVEWLALVSVDAASFQVGTSAVTSLGFGRVKALYR